MPRAARHATYALAIALSLAPLGCVQLSDFEPVGSAASVSGVWTVDGDLPTPESCAALGANVVRVTFLDGLRPVPHGALVFACATDCAVDGEAACFESGPVVREGTWTVRIEAVNGTTLVAAGAPQTITAEPMGQIALDPVAFFSGRISARYTIAGGSPSFASCDAAGIASVQLAFEGAGGTIAGDAVEPCTVGGVGTRVEPGSTYTVRLRALGPGGEIVAETAPETFEVEAGDHLTLADGAVIDLP